MTGTGLACRTEERRVDVRRAGHNGIDFLEVSDDQLRLCVHFLGPIPEGLTERNIRIEGGRTVRDITVTGMRRRPAEDGSGDDCLEVTVNRFGDASRYKLCIVDVDERGRPTGLRFDDFDQRYECIEFSFKEGCPRTLDCRPQQLCPPPQWDEPALDYLAKDYASFRRLLLDRLALVVPEWRERHIPDLGVTLVELFAYVADQLSYYQDAVATEAYLATARRRISVRRHARLVDYILHEGCSARAFVVVSMVGADVLTRRADEIVFVTSFIGAPPSGTLLDADDLPSGVDCFEPLVDDPATPIVLHAAHNEIELYIWGDQECCLPVGATSAWLADAYIEVAAEGAEGADATNADTPRRLQLAPGDFLVFEEVLGPDTGDPADADPAHRHVVRLTDVRADVDLLYEQPVVHVSWAEADALAFPLCISTVGPAPDCEVLAPVGVARGNVVLVDHGCTMPPERLDPVPDPPPDDACEGPCEPAASVPPMARYHPAPLSHRPLTFAQPLTPAKLPAATVLAQDPRQATPQVRLTSHGAQPTDKTDDWVPVSDLLGSGPDDFAFVVEVDDDGWAYLRFGDDRLGEAPDPGTAFTARQRVGNGRQGNVGAERIAFVALRGASESGVQLAVRNPLPAGGGTDPETVLDAKLLAPASINGRLERAVVPADYAALAVRDFPEIQAAAATLRWTGSWHEVLVAVDERGRSDAEPVLLDAVDARLERYRRIGHDVVVHPVEQVPVLVVVVVCVKSHHLRAEVEATLVNRFSNRTLADGTLGFFHPDNLRPGEPVSASRIVASVQATEGVESAEVIVLRRQFDPSPAKVISIRGGGSLIPKDGLLRLGPLEVARIDTDRSEPNHGAILFRTRGGR